MISLLARYNDELVAGGGQGPAGLVALWPAVEEGESQVSFLAPSTWLAAGRLYLLADGAAGCADGAAAAAQAVQAISAAYYSQPAGFSDPPAQRSDRLRKAVWSGQEVLQAWREGGLCRHHQPPLRLAAGLLSEVNREMYTCPQCGRPLTGLRAKVAAVVAYGSSLLVAGLGDILALYLRAGLGAPTERLAFNDQTLGDGRLTADDLRPYQLQLNEGDQLILANHATLSVLSQGKSQAGWQMEIRRSLGVPASQLAQAVERLLSQLATAARPGANTNLGLLTIRLPGRTSLEAARTELAGLRQTAERQPALVRVLQNQPDLTLWQEYYGQAASSPGGRQRTEPMVGVPDLPPADAIPVPTEWAMPVEVVVRRGLRQIAEKAFQQHHYAEAAKALLELNQTYPGLYLAQSSWQALWQEPQATMTLLPQGQWALLPPEEQAAWVALGELQVSLAYLNELNLALREAGRLHPPGPLNGRVEQVQRRLETVRPLLDSPLCPPGWRDHWQDGQTACQAATAWQLGNWPATLQLLNQFSQQQAERWIPVCQGYVTELSKHMLERQPAEVAADARLGQTMSLIRPAWRPTGEQADLLPFLGRLLAVSSSLSRVALLLMQPNQIVQLQAYDDWFRQKAWQEVEQGLTDGRLDEHQWWEAASYFQQPVSLPPDSQPLWQLHQQLLAMWQAAGKQQWGLAAAHAYQVQTSPALPQHLQEKASFWYDQYAEQSQEAALEMAADAEQLPTDHLRQTVEALDEQGILPAVRLVLQAALARQRGEAKQANQYMQDALREAAPAFQPPLWNVAHRHYHVTYTQRYLLNWSRRRSN